MSPLPPTGAATVITSEGTRLRLQAAALPAAATVEVAAGEASDGWQLLGADAAELEVRFAGRLELLLRCTLDAPEDRRAQVTRQVAHPPLRPERLWVNGARLHAAGRHRQRLARIRAGALRYLSGCSALQVAPREVCFLADHRLLPLSWTRDAYRSATGGLPEDGALAWSALVDEVWRSLPFSADGLVVTDENPADDRSHFPYLLSTQILAWYVATRLVELEGELGLRRLGLGDVACRLRDSVPVLFSRRGPHGSQWAYCGDLVRAEAALDRLVAVSSGDGLLPEAYDPDTGEWLARHWFAWPAAALGALVPARGLLSSTQPAHAATAVARSRA